MRRFFKKIVKNIEKSASISAIRTGLVMIIPILMIGSFSLVFMSMPINIYQDMIKSLCSGAFYRMLEFAHGATYGMLSVYIAFAIAYYYIKSADVKYNYAIVGGMTSIISFFILSGVSMKKTSIEPLGVKGMFVAIFCSIVVAKLFLLIVNNIKIPFRLYADGVDLEFNDAIFTMVPSIAIVIFIAILNYFVCSLGNADSFYQIYIKGICRIFSNKGNDFSTGFFYVVTSSILWFFGVHGTEVLGEVSNKIYAPAFVENVTSGLSGETAKEILTPQFFEQFVLIGGCGTALCLFIAIKLASRRRINRNLANISSVPIIFNINEIMLFGYPVIYNPYMLAPFLVTPILAYCVSYLAMFTGLVPVITTDVEWTTPIILGGYKATGSVAGAVLQVVIVLIGIVVYIPFVKVYDESRRGNEMAVMDELTKIMRKAEEDREDIHILEIGGRPGVLAKCLAADIRSAINDGEIRLFYQLQYDNDYKCIGAEALLRYDHPIYGFIYPPLIIKLAEESGVLSSLERFLFVQGAKESRKIKEVMGKSYKISVNVTIATILEESFIDFLKKLKKDYDIKDGEMCIEITEQMAIKSDSEFEKALAKVKQLGFLLAIDDFSMGSTSLKYLQKNQFDIVKLDGSIVKAMMTNERSKDIISSIVYLAKSLDFNVLAEYIENEDEIKVLRDIGCNYYQGYHFSKSVAVDEFISILEKDKNW